MQYAGASLDFNRIHYDDTFAREGGYPGVIAHGMLSMGFLGELLAHRFGPANVRRMKVRFKAVTYPGDVVTCRAEVTAVREDELDVKLWTETKPGTITVDGTATILLR